MVLTAYIVLSPGTGLFCPRHRRNRFRQLSASVGAPGPHDFAVRISAARLASPLRPPHPASNVRDDRDTPLLWRRDSRNTTTDFGFGKSEIFFTRGLDRFFPRGSDLPVGQSHCGHAAHALATSSLRGTTRRSNPLFFPGKDGLLRGACHRARVRATRWLAMTVVAAC